MAGATSATASSTPGSAAGVPVASRPASRSPSAGDGEHPERRDDHQVEQPVRHVVVAHVAELVGDDEPRLGGREVLQQVVVEHDALRVADAGHVGVGGGRAARGVDLVDLADVDAGLLGELEHVGARLALRQRRELVEQRVEHDRPSVGDDDAERHHDGGARRSTSGGRSGACRRPAARRRRPTARRRSPATWRRRRPSRPSPGSPGRRLWPAGARSLRPAAWRARGDRDRRGGGGAGQHRTAPPGARSRGGGRADEHDEDPELDQQSARRRATAGRCGSRRPFQAGPR